MRIRSVTLKSTIRFLLVYAKYILPLLYITFLFTPTAHALIGKVNINQFVWYHYTIIGAFALGVIIPASRSLTLSILIALFALYIVIEMLIAFDFVSDNWPRAEDD